MKFHTQGKGEQMTPEQRERFIDLAEEAIDGVHDMHALARQYAESATDAILAALPGMVVPPDWNYDNARGGRFATVFGTYWLAYTGKSWRLIDPIGHSTYHDTDAQAQVIVQADYSRRILSALGITVQGG
jgi:hypothetical protein